MPRHRLAVSITASAIAALAFVALSGCAQTSTTAVANYRGNPRGVEVPAHNSGESPFSVWLKSGDQFTVTLFGSSSCPPVATTFTLTSHNHVTLTVPKPSAKGKICTMDFVPHTTVFSTPNAIDRTKDVSITDRSTTWVLKAALSN